MPRQPHQMVTLPIRLSAHPHSHLAPDCPSPQPWTQPCSRPRTSKPTGPILSLRIFSGQSLFAHPYLTQTLLLTLHLVSLPSSAQAGLSRQPPSCTIPLSWPVSSSRFLAHSRALLLLPTSLTSSPLSDPSRPFVRHRVSFNSTRSLLLPAPSTLYSLISSYSHQLSGLAHGRPAHPPSLAPHSLSDPNQSVSPHATNIHSSPHHSAFSPRTPSELHSRISSARPSPLVTPAHNAT